MKHISIRIFLMLFSCLIILNGCARHVTKGDKFPLLYQERPVTILVLPPINQTTAADAKEYYATTIAEPLSLFGYYVLPIEVTSEILKMEGIYDTELLLRTPPQKFKTYFGADAVLYTTIEQWDVSYLVLSSKLTVAIRCVLKSAVSGETLWQRRSSVEVDLSGSNQSSAGYLGIVFKVAETAIRTAMADYVPCAMRANYIALATIPAGKYHPIHGKDRNEKFIDQIETKK